MNEHVVFEIGVGLAILGFFYDCPTMIRISGYMIIGGAVYDVIVILWTKGG